MHLKIDVKTALKNSHTQCWIVHSCVTFTGDEKFIFLILWKFLEKIH